MIDFEDCSPQDLAERATLQDLWEAVRAVEEWDNPKAEVLDYVYRHRLLALLRRGFDDGLQAELEELATHLRRLVPTGHRKELDNLRRPYATFWASYAHLLDCRLANLAVAQPEKVLTRKHVPEILELLASGQVGYQRELTEKFDFGKANLSRILKDMEKVELIQRSREGVDNRIELGSRAPQTYGDRLRNRSKREHGLGHIEAFIAPTEPLIGG